MTLNLKPFQESAVEELKKKIQESLGDKRSKIGFKSPTGSGKTIMMAETIKRIVEAENYNMDICFVWIAVNKLHLQSKDKLEKYYTDDPQLSCVEWKNVVRDNDIPGNHILFFNWSSINKDIINKINNDGESQVGLARKIQNTKENNRKIILIIDEGHHTADSEISKKIIDIIAPNVEIYVSATLNLNQANITPVIVKHEDVVDQQMIKKKIIVNDVLNAQKHVWDNKEVIKTALIKRNKLKSMYQDTNSNINPLVLIQIPNKLKSKTEATTLENIQEILSKHHITTANGKLAIYLSDSKDGKNKINLENIDDHDNNAEVLIFKQAIALGWDCPRASILVIFREMKSFEFSLQTLGRIMRMPELIHYPQESLNFGYIYTNLSKVAFRLTEQDFWDLNYIDQLKSEKSKLDDVQLLSEHIVRNNKQTKLNHEFHKLFNDHVNKKRISEKISKKYGKLHQNVVVGSIDNSDVEIDLNESMELNITEDEVIHKKFITHTEGLAGSLAGKASSEIIMQEVLRFFKNRLNIDESEAEKTFLLNKNNMNIIGQCITDTVLEYIKNSENESIKINKNPKWNIPKMMFYTKDYRNKKFKKSMMNPVHFMKGSNYQNELKFMKFLDTNPSVKWWFKNSENHKTDFSIVYVDDTGGKLYTNKHEFYVDFIVKSCKGKIWLLDTKEGSTLTDVRTKFKSGRLFNYIKKSKKTKLAGGIVRYNNKTKGWVYFNQRKYDYNITSSGWSPLIIT